MLGVEEGRYYVICNLPEITWSQTIKRVTKYLASKIHSSLAKPHSRKMKLKNSHYPTNRDVILKSAERWMSAKKKDDNVGKNLWRVHDKLYDLTDFAKRVRQYFNIGTAQ